MKRATLLAAASAIAIVASGVASATIMTAPPADSWTVTNYYKQTVYDPQQNKIGAVDDVLVDQSGKVTGLVIGVGGFLGMGEKDVIVPFSDVNMQKKDDKYWLSFNESKESLTSAPGFTYDRSTTTWKPTKA